MSSELVSDIIVHLKTDLIATGELARRVQLQRWQVATADSPDLVLWDLPIGMIQVGMYYNLQVWPLTTDYWQEKQKWLSKQIDIIHTLMQVPRRRQAIALTFRMQPKLASILPHNTRSGQVGRGGKLDRLPPFLNRLQLYLSDHQSSPHLIVVTLHTDVLPILVGSSLLMEKEIIPTTGILTRDSGLYGCKFHWSSLWLWKLDYQFLILPTYFSVQYQFMSQTKASATFPPASACIGASCPESPNHQDPPQVQDDSVQ